MPYTPTGRPKGRPRHATKYETVSFKAPQEFIDKVKRYARVHQRPVSALIREGLERLIRDGEPQALEEGAGTHTAQEYYGNTTLEYYRNTDIPTGQGETLESPVVLQEIRTTLALLEAQIQALGAHPVESSEDTTSSAHAANGNTVFPTEGAPKEPAPTFDAAVFYLGDLCPDEPDRHQYGTSGKSVRDLETNGCRGCAIAAKQLEQRLKVHTPATKRPRPRKAAAI